ncbi:hypothetical protein AAE485_03345 [Acidithiobacillus ferriphilus]|uniref:STM4504/CBY_0614 family protein n=1 Tax=Acidithiobacillus ferriphilus TaxID=1689834 RepID=UPI00390CAD7A
MAIYDIFSKRFLRSTKVRNDVYVYDVFPDSLRVKLIYAIQDVIKNSLNDSGIFERSVQLLCREYGLFALVENPPYKHGYRDFAGEVNRFIMMESDVYRVIDAVELVFSLVLAGLDNWNVQNNDPRRMKYIEIVAELNERFKEHSIGYQFDGSYIIRIDSQLVHVEVIKPTLALIQKRGYEVVESEFIAAFEHYRHGRNSSAMNECLKAFESTMKVICDKNKWDYAKTATASPLIDVCLRNGLVPDYWSTQFKSLKSILESSVPTGRNKESAHGQGSERTEIPNYLVSYMINMTASAIVFLVSASNK